MPTIKVAVVAAGSMGAAIGSRLVNAGCIVFSVLQGRSRATQERAASAGLQDINFSKLPTEVDWVLSILPPSEAMNFAKSFLSSYKAVSLENKRKTTAFVDCNAVSPSTAKQIGELFDNSGIAFLDAGIIGGPPNGGYNPTIYASANSVNTSYLDIFESFSSFGLKVRILRGDESSPGKVGDASALKMSYAGITKGITGLLSAMILSAHAESPATSKALLEELSMSQATPSSVLTRIKSGLPSMIPKAYRWVGEMNEIASFVDAGLKASQSSVTSSPDATYEIGNIYRGLAALYQRIEDSRSCDSQKIEDVQILLNFVDNVKNLSLKQ